jgi:hypothetical protein
LNEPGSLTVHPEQDVTASEPFIVALPFMSSLSPPLTREPAPTVKKGVYVVGPGDTCAHAGATQKTTSNAKNFFMDTTSQTTICLLFRLQAQRRSLRETTRATSNKRQ